MYALDSNGALGQRVAALDEGRKAAHWRLAFPRQSLRLYSLRKKIRMLCFNTPLTQTPAAFPPSAQKTPIHRKARALDT